MFQNFVTYQYLCAMKERERGISELPKLYNLALFFRGQSKKWIACCAPKKALTVILT